VNDWLQSRCLPLVLLACSNVFMPAFPLDKPAVAARSIRVNFGYFGIEREISALHG